MILADGYVEGEIVQNRRHGVHCDVCGEYVLHGLEIMDTSFPDEFGWEATVLNKPVQSRDSRIDLIGIECGCYGRLHRQIAHIRNKMGLK